MESQKPIVYICTNLRPEHSPKPSCARRGSEKFLEIFKQELQANHCEHLVDVENSGCLGACEDGATVMFFEEQIWYGNVQVEDIARIVKEHIKEGKPVEALFIKRLMQRRRLP
ncbi:MAG: (2Fe-2S) ferredoxin domain-containing protein [Chloroherpetonaceae bacterium]